MKKSIFILASLMFNSLFANALSNVVVSGPDAEKVYNSLSAREQKLIEGNPSSASVKVINFSTQSSKIGPNERGMICLKYISKEDIELIGTNFSCHLIK